MSADGVRVVILAGGRGQRLAPYTSVLPKPLMPIGDQAILEIVVDQLVQHGFRRITLCVGYLSHLIQAVFDNHYHGGAVLDYVRETEPLGTAGPLRLVDGLEDTFLVMNGDLLTDLDYRDLLDYHRRCANALTIATHERRNTIDYGVLHTERNGDAEWRVTGYDEKPELALTVSMGVYLMEPAVLKYIPARGYFDFPALVLELLKADQRVGAYPFAGYWLDIGRRDDYEEAIKVWETWPRRSPSASA